MLDSLVEYYEYLRERRPDEVSPPGWGTSRIAAFLDINKEGELIGVISADEEGGAPRRVPKQVERSSGVAANFLCDTSSYLLGIDAKGKPERAVKCFEAARDLHGEALSQSEGETAQAVKSFFAKWKPDEAEDNPVVQGNIERLLSGRNLAFAVEGKEALKDEAIAKLVDERAFDSADSPQMVSLVSGKKMPIARLHPKIKGLPNAQTSGAVLVGFNAPSFTSYGRDDDQGMNAPIGEYEAFAYTTALNYLIADPSHHIRIDDTTIVYWALSNDEVCSEEFSFLLEAGKPLQAPWAAKEAAEGEDAAPIENPDHVLDAIMKSVREGKKVGDEKVDAPFFVLGLSPNAARVSVRFFLASTFGDVVSNIASHYERLQIAHGSFGRKYLSVKQLVWEVENPNAKQGKASNVLTGALMRSMLANADYPTALFHHALMRIKATQDNEEKRTRKVDYGRAAIIRAFLIKNCGYQEEELTVKLNENRQSAPYALGRLFAVMERVQVAAAKGRTINSTIVDRYFNAACATPGVVFPVIEKLGMAHLAKLRKEGREGYFVKLLSEINRTIHDEAGCYPSRLTIEEQGDFIIGYWCQREDFFNHSKDTEETDKED